MKQSIILKTERLRIRDHRLEDLETHHQLFSDRTTMYYLQDIMTQSMEDSRNNLMDTIEAISHPERTQYFFRIEDKVTHEHIGEIGYTVTEFTPVGKCGHLGYFSYKKHWNKGYMTEAVKEVLRFAFEENNVYRISTGCIRENAGSEHVMQKCGLIKEGEFKEKEWHDGRMKDRVVYRMLRREWEQRGRKQETLGCEVGEVTLRSLYICVKDMTRAINFYEVLLGMKVTERDEVYSVFDIKGFRMGLFANDKVKEVHIYGDNCLPSLEVEDIQTVQERLEILGCSIVFPMIRIKNNWVLEFEDTEGNHIEVTSPVRE